MTNPKNEPREVLLIGGPADGITISITNDKVMKYVVPMRGFDKYEYTIKKCQDGTWIGE